MHLWESVRGTHALMIFFEVFIFIFYIYFFLFFFYFFFIYFFKNILNSKKKDNDSMVKCKMCIDLK
jgi:hypothetical protein